MRQDFWLNGRVHSGLWVVDFMARQAGTTERDRLRFGQRLAVELRDTQPLVAGVNRPALNRYWKRVLGDQVDICAVPMMVRALRPESIARSKLKSELVAKAAGIAGRVAIPIYFRPRPRQAPAGARVEPIPRFDARFDALWRDVAPGFSHLAVRDATYLNWRYCDAPDREYSRVAAWRGDDLLGWVVGRSFRDGQLAKGRIVDILARRDDVETWHYLIDRAVAGFEAAGVDLVHGLGSTVGELVQAYRECGFRENPAHARESQYIAYNRIDGLDQDAFYNGDNWHVSLGDSDTDFAAPE
jgi:hypothetical protein